MKKTFQPTASEPVTVLAFDEDTPWGPIHTMKKTFQQMVEEELSQNRKFGLKISFIYTAYEHLFDFLGELYAITKNPQTLADRPKSLTLLIRIAAIAQRAAEDLKLMEEKQ